MAEILVFGDGWLGSRISEFLKCPISKVTIGTYENIQKEIDTIHPRVLINCIDLPGTNVDECEIDKTKTLSCYTFLPLLLAEAAIRNGLKLVHISSGDIFRYDFKINNPIKETDMPDFHDLYYSRAKIYIEAALAAMGNSANILQLRTRMPLDYIPHPKNLLDKLLRFKSVIDIPNSVTYVPDFLEALKYLLKKDEEGIFNVVSYGELRFRELLEEYRKYIPTYSYVITGMQDLKLVRTNLILSTDKLEEAGFEVRDIHDIIPECIEKYLKEFKK